MNDLKLQKLGFKLCSPKWEMSDPVGTRNFQDIPAKGCLWVVGPSKMIALLQSAIPEKRSTSSLYELYCAKKEIRINWKLGFLDPNPKPQTKVLRQTGYKGIIFLILLASAIRTSLNPKPKSLKPSP